MLIKFVIRLTSPCMEDPLGPHFYIVKLGYAGVYFVLLFHTTIFILVQFIHIYIFSTKNYSSSNTSMWVVGSGDGAG